MDLHSCKVIVDGNNLRFCLYNGCPVKNSCFGGDYKKYYIHVKSYFQRLLDCDIEVLVLMDGSFEPAKKPTLYHRAKEQARASVSCSPITHQKNVVLPLFAKEVFLQAIRDLGIPIVQTENEADYEIARQGSRVCEKPCYVISNDTDFCIFNVNVVSLDSTISSDLPSSSEGNPDLKCLHCRQFDRMKFLSFFKIGADKSYLLHVMATLCGNDYVKNSNGLERIFGQIPKVPKGSRKSMNPRHQRMFSLLNWLSNEKDDQSALKKLLEAVPLARRDALRHKLQSSIDLYNLEKEDEDGSFESKGGNPVDQSFLKFYREAFFPHWVLDISRHRLCFLPNQVEDVSKVSSHEFAAPIFEKICRVILHQDLESLDDPDEALIVQMVARSKYSTQCRKFSFQKDEDQQPEDGKTSLLQTLRVETESSSRSILTKNPEWSLIFLCLNFWLEKSFEDKSQEVVSQLELASILVSLSLWKMSGKLAVPLSDKVYDLGRMLRDPKHHFDISVVHALANFQAVLYHASTLNRILGNVFPDPMPMNLWWNGTLMYNLAAGYVFASEADVRKKLLSLDENLLRCYEENYSILESAISAMNRLRLGSNIGSRSKRRNKKKESQSDDRSSDFEFKNEIKIDSSSYYSDLSNRFSLLPSV